MSNGSKPVSIVDFIVDRSNVGIFVVDRDSKVVLWNQFMEINSSRKADTVIGKNLFDEFPELPRNWLERKIENVFILKNFSFTSWEQRPYLFRFPHNRPVTGGVDCMRQDCTLMPIKDDTGEVQYVCFTLFDTTNTSIYQQQLEKLTEELRESGNRDGLTRLYNRRHIEEILSREYDRAKRYGHKLSVIMVDIDHFKQVNDTCGHMVGDEVLRVVAQKLKAGLRSMDSVGRFGGEEFILVLPETDGTGAISLAERLRVAIEIEPITAEGENIAISISLGVTVLNGNTVGYEQLMSEADNSLYQSKKEGRNRCTLFQPTR